MKSVLQNHYEEMLASFSHPHRAVELLRNHRPYFEKIPSIRRSRESVITIPLPIVKVRQRQLPNPNQDSPYELIGIPCDLALLMCDPEWQIKTDIEIFIFIHRPTEGLSDLLRRWRETQVLLSRGYSWEMPLQHQHIFSEGADKPYPLFVLSTETTELIERGLQGACLPHVTVPISVEPDSSSEMAEAQSQESPISQRLDINLEVDSEIE
jgi:hypothetical protein